jgi:hypothetical protein
MITGECLDNLIESAWRIIDGDPETKVFQPWREKCVDCLSRLMGSDHYYTKCFQDLVQHADYLSVLAAGGILNAAKEEIRRNPPTGECPIDWKDMTSQGNRQLPSGQCS